MIIYVNGQFCDEREAGISVYDHGFLYGMGLFETFRTYNGKAFLLEEHLTRLKQGCNELLIRINLDLQQISWQVAQLLKRNDLQDGYIRLSVSAGNDQLGLPMGEYTAPVMIIYIKPLPLMDENIYENGKPLQLLQLQRNTPEGESRLKSFHYMNNILAKREIAKYPWAQGAEGLFLNSEGATAEGIASNLFFISQGRYFTPSIDTGILPGITRAFVMELVKNNGSVIEQGYYDWDRLKKADEIFVTNSIQEIMPITSLFDPSGNKQLVGNGKAGILTRNLRKLYLGKV